MQVRLAFRLPLRPGRYLILTVLWDEAFQRKCNDFKNVQEIRETTILVTMIWSQEIL